MNDSQKKQIPLRLSPKLYEAIAAWAEDDFRSVNGQIEYLLSECVRQRKKNGKYVSDEIDLISSDYPQVAVLLDEAALIGANDLGVVTDISVAPS